MNTIQKCNCCQIEKSLLEFYFRKKIQSYRKICKNCLSLHNKIRRINNPEVFKTRSDNYYLKNRQKILIKTKEYRSNHIEKYKILSKNNNLKYIDYHKKYNKTWYQQNKHKINEKNKYRRKNDLIFHIITNYRSRILTYLKRCPKSQRTVDLLGCSPIEFRQYLEKQFNNGMSWLNYKNWQIDHRIPLSFFNMSDPTEQKQAFHYTNCQPLWTYENLEKGDRIIKKYASFLILK